MPTTQLKVSEVQAEVSVSGVHGHTARLTLEDGRELLVSRIEGRTEWIVDGANLANGLPIFYNGLFSRCTALRQITDSGVVRTLDSMARNADIARSL